MATLMASFERGGSLDLNAVADAFRMSKGQLAELLGLPASVVTKTARSQSGKAQQRTGEMIEILNRIRGWAGSDLQALAWYRSQPIPALDGRTAEALVKSGKAAWVRDYLDHMALGGYA